MSESDSLSPSSISVRKRFIELRNALFDVHSRRFKLAEVALLEKMEYSIEKS